MNFDATAYWQDRMRQSSLATTGLQGMPLSWQQSLYRQSERVLFGLLGDHVTLSGASVLNFGCGTGYFDEAMAGRGARVAGIDLSAETIARLRAKHPNRIYRAGELASEVNLVDGLGQFDLVTAIDVLYHITDEPKLRRTVERLRDLVMPGGYFLITEGTRLTGNRPHVHHHPVAWWDDVVGWPRVATKPVFVVHGRSIPRGAKYLPEWAGALIGRTQECVDVIARPLHIPPKTVALLYQR